MSRSITFFTTAIAIVSMPVLADTRIEYADEQSGKMKTTISVKDGDVRIDEGDGGGYTLYRGADRLLIFVDNKERTYTEMNEASMDKMAGQVSEAMAEMNRQLEQMSPEQREMMERMMGGMKDAGASMFEMKVDRTGKQLNKAGHDCEQVFFSIGSLARTELCVVDPGEISMPAADRRALDAMQNQMQRFAKKMTQNAGINFTFDFNSMGGLPVYMKEQRDPSAEVLKGVSRDRLDAALFRVPEGYRKEAMNMN